MDAGLQPQSVEGRVHDVHPRRRRGRAGLEATGDGYQRLDLHRRLTHLLGPRCGRCQGRDNEGRAACPHRHTHEAAPRCLVIGHAPTAAPRR